MPSSADLPGGQVGGIGGTTLAPAAPSDVDPLATTMTATGGSSMDTVPATRGVPSSGSTPVDSQPGFVIGQVWSESAAAPDPSTTQAAETAAPGVSTLPATSVQSTDPAISGGHGGTVFDAFNQLPPSQTQALPTTSEPSSSSPFSSGLSQTSGISQNSAGGDGDRFSALMSELQAFNQQSSSQPLPGTAPSEDGAPPPSSSPMAVSYPADTAAAPAEGSGEGVNAHPLTLTSSAMDVKKDPGDIGVNIATAVLRESTEAAASEAPETFLAPLGPQGALHGGLEGYRKRSGSASSHSQGTPSPTSGSLVGPESVVIETSECFLSVRKFTSTMCHCPLLCLCSV